MLERALVSRLKMKAEQIECYTASAGTQETRQRDDHRVLRPRRECATRPPLLGCRVRGRRATFTTSASHLFHYDVPWSIIRLTQRNGARSTAFGQHHPPQLRYLARQRRRRVRPISVSWSASSRRSARSSASSATRARSWVCTADADSEEEFLLRGVARGDDAETLVPDAPLAQGNAADALAELNATLDGVSSATALPTGAGGIDLLALFAEVQKEQARAPGLDKLVADPPSLFRNDYELLVAALRHLEHHSVVGAEPIEWKHNDVDTSVEVFAPEPFRRHREGFLPREAVPEKDSPYRLAMGRGVVTDKLRVALDDEGRWPDWHLLWEQHPIVEWLLDALGSAYARGEAPLRQFRRSARSSRSSSCKP